MDSIHLRQIFPEEIWEMVSSNLVKQSPSDLESFANSSPFFRNLLAPKRSVFLFEKVIEAVDSTVWTKSSLEGLPIRDLVKYREVCSHWSCAVDKLLPQTVQRFENDYRGYDVRRLIRNSFNRYNIDSLQKLVEHFKSTHPVGRPEPYARSPFILRDLSINVTERPYRNEYGPNHHSYMEGLDALILAYGGHVQHLTIDVGWNVEFFSSSPKLRRWFAGMPNLTRLSVYCEYDGVVSKFVRCQENDDAFNLKHLKCLDTRNLPSALFNQLIRQNSHVSTLVMKNCKDDYDFFTFPLPNLKKLEMEYCSAQLLITLGFPEVDWHLESLALVFDNGDNVGCSSFLQLIQNKFANTLVDLDLTLHAADTNVEGPVWEAFKSCRLDLPKLKNLKLDVCANLTCLEFLLPMRNNLEQLSVNGGLEFPLVDQNRVTRDLIVQFIGFEGKMLESNIWNIFPKLRKVEVAPRWDRVNLSRHWSYSRKD